ncbi:MAG: Asp-tRNA(Asn)/Glu-tRNA(Gln) amidotransferase subunit GatA [Candidatus Wallbacteria bacterium]|nr:Asp-tRNA(Asn)/Glu-tRNA(Gln) amidotransferase subunit GatA [Candidatus Wallbacteria bacterium]
MKTSLDFAQRLAVIGSLDEKLGAFLHLDKSPSCSDGKISGLPVAVKDNIAVLGMPLTCASRVLEGHYPAVEATAVKRIRAEGALIAGKTNMDEFAMGSSTENSAFKLSRNPWDLERVPGGSSGGSAAAVASGMVPVALGSDTGGSVRQPAAFCGIAGFKPSYGAVSRYGLVAYGSSLDQIGIMAAAVSDIKRIFDMIRGPDGFDETVAEKSFFSEDRPDRKVRIGIVEEYLHHPSLEPEILRAMEAAREKAVALGADVLPVKLPMLDETVIPAYYLTACAEASSNLGRYDGIRYGARSVKFPADLDELVFSTRNLFGPEVKLRIMLGTFVLRAGHYDQYYGRAQAARRKISCGLAESFTKVDFLLTPVFPTRAFKIGEFTSDPIKMKLADEFTVTANLAGIPAISLPVGVDGGLPTSVQLMGPRFSDLRLLEFAAELESMLKFDASLCPHRVPEAV